MEIDWKKNMLTFMKIVGDRTNDWHPELWTDYGISEEDALTIINEYEKRFPEDSQNK